MPHQAQTFDEFEPVERTIAGVATSIAAFVGRTRSGPIQSATLIESWDDFERLFGGLDNASTVSFAVRDFYRNGGQTAYIVRLSAENPSGARIGIRSNGAATMPVAAETNTISPLTEDDYVGAESERKGIFALESVDLFNLLCIPPDLSGGTLPAGVHAAAAVYCLKRRAILIVDPPATWTSPEQVILSDLGIEGDAARNAVLYFPRVNRPNELHDGEVEPFVPCGVMAGVMARMDAGHGVWRAPAGIDVRLEGVTSLTVTISDQENSALNRAGVSCLRMFADYGAVSWGARTLAASLTNDEKYLPVRRLQLYVEESIRRGLEWAVSEPNDESLWSEIRLAGGEFMQTLFESGAFAGNSPEEAYSVLCDATTTTADDIARGVINIIVSFAPLTPAEFIVVKIEQSARPA